MIDCDVKIGVFCFMNGIKNHFFWNDYTSLLAFATAHFAVDFCCAFLLFRLLSIGSVSDVQAWGFFLTYNALAFGLEIFIGPFFNSRTARVCSCLGCATLAIGLGLGAYVEDLVLSINAVFQQTSIENVSTGIGGDIGLSLNVKKLADFSLLAFVLAGVGNAFFHVGGGIDSLSRNVGKYWRGGTFISTGALGLAWGGIAGREKILPFTAVLGGLAVITVILWICGKNEKRMGVDRFHDLQCMNASKNDSDGPIDTSFEFFYGKTWFLVPLNAVLFVIFVRSFVGFEGPEIFSERSLRISPLLIAYASFLGKFVGGFCADLWGGLRVGFFALLGTVPTLCWGDSVWIFLLGIVLLNVSTAITLLSAAKSCAGNIGFAFGLTTLALLGGYLLFDLADAWFNQVFQAEHMNTAIAFVILLTACIFAIGEKILKRVF